MNKLGCRRRCSVLRQSDTEQPQCLARGAAAPWNMTDLSRAGCFTSAWASVWGKRSAEGGRGKLPVASLSGAEGCSFAATLGGSVTTAFVLMARCTVFEIASIGLLEARGVQALNRRGTDLPDSCCMLTVPCIASGRTRK